LVKGGHLKGDPSDVLYLGDSLSHEFIVPRIQTPHTHGSGCTFAAAITAELAKRTPLPEAVRRAKEFITEAIRTAPGLGAGNGPLNHHA
jgi:hydroxymethylpyrimidine/phosphomethylpyrimidine kinase